MRPSVATVSFVILVSALACGAPTPERVWVPGENGRTDCGISVTTQTVKVGETITLNAWRRTDGFVEVDRATLPETTQWWTDHPPRDEPDAAWSLRWIVEPEGSVRFNRANGSFDHPRTATFTRAGTYWLTGSSATWMSDPVDCGALEIVVTP